LLVAKAVRSNRTKASDKADDGGEKKRSTTTAKNAPAKGSSAKSTSTRRQASKRARGKSDKGRAAARPGERKGLFKFFHDVRIEMGKVTWPTRRDLMQSTLVVLVAVAIAASVIAVYDFVFARLVSAITGLFS